MFSITFIDSMLGLTTVGANFVALFNVLRGVSLRTLVVAAAIFVKKGSEAFVCSINETILFIHGSGIQGMLPLMLEYHGKKPC